MTIREEQVLERIARARGRRARLREDAITLAHGSGGKATRTLVDAVFKEAFGNPLLDPEEEAKIGHVRFESLTVRAFKLEVEDRCEDYGQVATYRGTIPHHPHAFALDDHHRFESGRPMLVCGNTADMLAKTRYAAHFTVSERGAHFGLFDCAPPATATTAAACC